MIIIESSDNVFADLGFDREEAANLKMRGELMRIIIDTIQSRGLTQQEAAKLFGVSQPRVSNLVRGKIDLFAIDSLVSMLAKAEIEVALSVASTPVASKDASQFQFNGNPTTFEKVIPVAPDASGGRRIFVSSESIEDASYSYDFTSKDVVTTNRMLGQALTKKIAAFN